MQPIVAVGAVVLREGAILLVQRNKAPHKGMWTIPGGRVHFGESLHAAAERELQEETTVFAQAQYPVFVFDLIERDTAPIHFVIVDVLAKYISGEPRGRSDAGAAQWVYPKEFSSIGVEEKTWMLVQRLLAADSPLGR